MTDPLFAPEERAWGLNEKTGRYDLPDPEDPAAWEPGAVGARKVPRGWMRTTNLISAYSDIRALMIWEERKILEGLADRPDLYADLCVLEREETGDLKRADGIRIAEEALKAAKANSGAVLGTAYHTALERRVRTGQLTGTPDIQDGVLALERVMRDRLLLPEPLLAERMVVNIRLRCAGRFDLPLWDLSEPYAQPRLLMADLKTKAKQFWSVLEQRAQLAVYAYADAMWDDDKQCYVPMPPFDREKGVLLHVPSKLDAAGMREIKLLSMDLRAGWATAQRAFEVVQDRANAKSAPYLRGLEMPATPLNSPDRIKARLELVQSFTEGSEVLSQLNEYPHGMPAEELDVLVKETIARISAESVDR
jgi:hypothetical protein